MKLDGTGNIGADPQAKAVYGTKPLPERYDAANFFGAKPLPLQWRRALPTLGSVPFRVRPVLRKEFFRVRTLEYLIRLAGFTAASAKLGGRDPASALSGRPAARPEFFRRGLRPLSRLFQTPHQPGDLASADHPGAGAAPGRTPCGDVRG
uniref:Uncharacterized protein n=1 Tax=mine drainage metagenome TaxID=410659 RepID=E6QER5_9ZZZZ